MKNSEILNQIEKEEYFSALDWSIDHLDFELLDYMLKKHWDNQSFRKAISNSLLANVLDKSESTAFIQKVFKNFVSYFSYEDKEGHVYKFVLEA